jgi:hypothetical protein
LSNSGRDGSIASDGIASALERLTCGISQFGAIGTDLPNTGETLPAEQSAQRARVEKYEVAWRIESEPVFAEAAVAVRLDVRRRDPERALGTQELPAAGDRLTRVVQVLDHVVERYRVE